MYCHSVYLKPLPNLPFVPDLKSPFFRHTTLAASDNRPVSPYLDHADTAADTHSSCLSVVPLPGHTVISGQLHSVKVHQPAQSCYFPVLRPSSSRVFQPALPLAIHQIFHPRLYPCKQGHAYTVHRLPCFPAKISQVNPNQN